MELSAETNFRNSKRKSHHLKIDMTPMVDLAFLLLTFFILTATFNKPCVLKLTLPPKKMDKMPGTPISNGLTLIMGNDGQIFWYWGKMGKDKLMNRTAYGDEGLRQLLLAKNLYMLNKLALYNKKWSTFENQTVIKNEAVKELQTLQKDPYALVVIIKNEGGARYGDVVDIVDELRISKVGNYFIVDENINELEKEKIGTLRNKKAAL